jgi:hypothetical protein
MKKRLDYERPYHYPRSLPSLLSNPTGRPGKMSSPYLQDPRTTVSKRCRTKIWKTGLSGYVPKAASTKMRRLFLHCLRSAIPRFQISSASMKPQITQILNARRGQAPLNLVGRCLLHYDQGGLWLPRNTLQMMLRRILNGQMGLGATRAFTPGRGLRSKTFLRLRQRVNHLRFRGKEARTMSYPPCATRKGLFATVISSVSKSRVACGTGNDYGLCCGQRALRSIRTNRYVIAEQFLPIYYPMLDSRNIL